MLRFTSAFPLCLFAAPIALLCIGCASEVTHRVKAIELSYPSPSLLMSTAEDSLGWKFGGAISRNRGPVAKGTSAESGSGGDGARSIPEAPDNMRIRFEDLSSGAYLTFFSKWFAANLCAELSGIDGEVYHRVEGTLWGRMKMGPWDIRAGMGLSQLDVLSRAIVDNYLYDSGEYETKYTGSDTLMRMENIFMPSLAIHAGYLACNKIRIGLSMARYAFSHYSVLGANHTTIPVTLSLAPKTGSRIQPMLALTYMLNTADQGAGQLKATAGIGF